MLNPAVPEDDVIDPAKIWRPMIRPSHMAAFRNGASCTVTRVSMKGGLAYVSEGLIEAYITGETLKTTPPLKCADVSGEPLFLLRKYEAADNGLEVIDPEDRPIGTFIMHSAGMGHFIEVRDETSAPVAQLNLARGGDWIYELVETGGSVIGGCSNRDQTQDDLIDDEWIFRQIADELPLKKMTAIAIPLVTKVMFGRRLPQTIEKKDR